MVPERDLRVEDPYWWLGACVDLGQDLGLSPWARTGPVGMSGSLVAWDASTLRDMCRDLDKGQNPTTTRR